MSLSPGVTGIDHGPPPFSYDVSQYLRVVENRQRDYPTSAPDLTGKISLRQRHILFAPRQQAFGGSDLLRYRQDADADNSADRNWARERAKAGAKRLHAISTRPILDRVRASPVATAMAQGAVSVRR